MQEFVKDLLRSLEPGDVVDRWSWRVFGIFLVCLYLYDVFFRG